MYRKNQLSDVPTVPGNHRWKGRQTGNRYGAMPLPHRRANRNPPNTTGIPLRINRPGICQSVFWICLGNRMDQPAPLPFVCTFLDLTACFSSAVCQIVILDPFIRQTRIHHGYCPRLIEPILMKQPQSIPTNVADAASHSEFSSNVCNMDFPSASVFCPPTGSNSYPAASSLQLRQIP